MVVGSIAIFTKMLSVEDVPYAFTYGDTVVASYRWLMTGFQNSIIQGAPEIEVRKSLCKFNSIFLTSYYSRKIFQRKSEAVA